MFDKDTLRQIVEGLSFLHSNGIVHGNLTEKSIVKQEEFFKISMLGATGGSYKDDIRALGKIIRINNKTAEHLVKCLTDDEVPDASEILYHPFFWDDVCIAAFFSLAYLYQVGSDVLVCSKHVCVTHRDVLLLFANAYEQNRKALTKICASYCRSLPQLTLLTWLKLQPYKEDPEICHVYSSKYNWSPHHGLCDGVEQTKRVHFADPLFEIRILEDNEIHRKARIGTWKQDGDRDRMRFSRLLENASVILAPMLMLKLLAILHDPKVDPKEKYLEWI